MYVNLQGLSEVITWMMLISHYHITIIIKTYHTYHHTIFIYKTMESFTASTTLLIYTIPEKCVAMGVLQLCTICQHVHTKQI
jgi:hypothetical protein